MPFLKNITAKLLLPVLCFACILTTAAQEKHCKALVRANRKVTVSTEANLEFLEMTWRNDKYTFQQFRAHYTGAFNKQSSCDSIVTELNTGQRVCFLVNGIEIISPAVSYPDRAGNLWTDSIKPEGKHYNHYFNAYRSSHVTMTSNDKQRARLYYNHSYGGDSLYIRYHPNGSPDSIVWYSVYGQDTARQLFTPDHILTYAQSAAGTGDYNQGRLLLFTFDTLVNDRKIQGKRLYYDNGILRSVAYTNDGVPCLTWKYYREDGRLSASIKKAPVKSEPQPVTILEAPPPPMIMTRVEQTYEYPGGSNAFKKSCKEHLQEALCKADKPLRGVYRLTLRVDPGGYFDILKMDGENAASFLAALKTTGIASEKPKAGKVNGWPATQTFCIGLKIQ